MKLLTYVFKGNYYNRTDDKVFIEGIISTFNKNEITGLGISVNNNPWNFQFYIFVTLDECYLEKSRFNQWIKNKYPKRVNMHNLFFNNSMRNSITFCDDIDFFDSVFVFDEYIANLPLADRLKKIFNGRHITQNEFEAEYPQYKEISSTVPTVFVSHSSLDKETIALPLIDYLCSEKVSIWLDQNEIISKDICNDELRQKIRDGIELCDTGVFILTSNFFESEWTQFELAHSQKANKNILLIISDLNLIKKHPYLLDYDYVLLSDIQNNYELVRSKLTSFNN